MTIEEAGRFSVMKRIDTKEFGLRKASEELGLSLRQTKRIRKRYLKFGAEGLISGHRGKTSPNKTDPALREAVMTILHREEYLGFGPTFAGEKLRERHGYVFSEETLRRWMIQEGLWKAKIQRRQKVYQRRARRRRFGELLQGDGSRHDWFEGRGNECSLLIFVDDATSKLTAGRFFHAETTDGYQKVLEEHLKKYGRPLALYVDRHSIFRTTRDTSGARESETHIGRVLRDLDIELICAHSPQAKGRVERANGVLQDRLIKEMRLRGICTIEAANQFLPHFIEDYNRRFGKEPQESGDAHRVLRSEDNLERIFARRAMRKLSKNLSFQYEGTLYQIQTDHPHRFLSTYVDILDTPGKPIVVESRNQEQRYTTWREEQRLVPQILDSKELEAHWTKRTSRKPGRHHPWR